MRRLRCESCKHFELKGENFGKCKSDKFEYGYESELLPATKYDDDMLLYMDYEGYNAGVEVGKNFGCIHHEKVDQS